MVKVCLFGGAYCSNCKLPMKPSQAEGLKDSAFRVMGFHPVRCHRCCDRIYRRKRAVAAAPRRKRSRQVAHD